MSAWYLIVSTISARAGQDEMKGDVMKKIKVIQTVQDSDCPLCKFPETVQIRNEKTMEVLGERCSNRKCRYFVLYSHPKGQGMKGVKRWQQ
jgi:hypothetical protein